MFCCVPNNTPFPSNATAKIYEQPNNNQKKCILKMNVTPQRHYNTLYPIPKPKPWLNTENSNEISPLFFGMHLFLLRRRCTADSSGHIFPFVFFFLVPSLPARSESKIIIKIIEILACDFRVVFFPSPAQIDAREI